MGCGPSLILLGEGDCSQETAAHQLSPSLIIGEIQRTLKSHCSLSPQKQSCTAEAESKLQNPETCVPQNFRAKYLVLPQVQIQN